MKVGAITYSGCVGTVAVRRGGLLALLAHWHRRAVTRAALRDLPPQLLRDVGLTATDAAYEAARPFWKP
jgi:uncharacterized protein YjiS (DUF1127 family)